MVLKKIDPRIKLLIENGVANQHRSLFIIVGDKARDQVPILHQILSKASVRARPSVLWCYKVNEKISKLQKGIKDAEKRKHLGKNMDKTTEDPYQQFIVSTKIRFCFYAETDKILGNTFGMCVLQDFEAITPNVLARTIETTEGGGIVVVLFNKVSSLKQLYTMTMDVHSRYRTEAHRNVVPRFNERFILSLGSCQTALVMDDKFNILPISSKIAGMHHLAAASKALDESNEKQLQMLKDSLQETQPIGSLINCCRTVDQAQAVLQFTDAITEKTLRSTVTLTAARGRGKSAALGLAIAAAVAHGYSNIFVTSPSPENLKTLFDLVLKGFEALGYQEHTDYDIVRSSARDQNKAIIRLNIYRNHRQTVQYVLPTEGQKLGQAELVVIDEAAAIPLPLVKELIGPYLVFMASTINGYEGTGRALSLKLINQLRKQSTNSASANARRLRELELTESIRYRAGDAVEAWLNDLLCLNVSSETMYNSLSGGSPPPDTCDLYYINRDTLFSYHKASEEFLHRVMSLLVASHYKNSPNDLQMLSDAPAHHIFCLLGPVDNTKSELPEIYCVVQVALEGAISKSTVKKEFSNASRASGDMIPWTIGQQFQDNSFPSLSGVRIVRIAVHPNYQKMGYGSRALHLLEMYYKGLIPATDEIPEEDTGTISTVKEDEIDMLQEKIKPRKNPPPLLFKLTERRAEKIDWLGTSFGLTGELLRFWKRSGFVPLYVRQTSSELTGEHSCTMMKIVDGDAGWLKEFFLDFRKRFINLLPYQFRTFAPQLALDVLQDYKNFTKEELLKPIKWAETDLFLTKYDIRRLNSYAAKMFDYHVVVDLLPVISRMYFSGQLGTVHLSDAQARFLLGLGLQCKSVDDLASALNATIPSILSILQSEVIRKVVAFFRKLAEEKIDAEMIRPAAVDITSMRPSGPTLDEELEEAEKEYSKKVVGKKEAVRALDLDQFKIAAADMDLDNALQNAGKRKATEQTPGVDMNGKFIKKRKQNLEKKKKKSNKKKA
ncbi:RNA cytidine acetyltransferase-like [Paramacrobiotus metropolitanus]|uniref:RNA cytidine acetyltransferase-like n=1 Tax=Paramacrobiotus metropolitanus TaxID=2943436 RepID=UPI002445BC76|nr:RNA cytidine acetyltransferase-like [Paramacrobiotus metropolitanus]